MYSKAKIFGQPIHPLLSGFPLAFYSASFLGYICFHFNNLESFWFDVAYVANVAGIITAIIAAIPGFIDWAFGVPSGTPAKATGFVHMICNISALAFFSASAVYNHDQLLSTNPNSDSAVILSTFGIILTLLGGLLGWKMISTYHVGVELSPEQEKFESS